MSIPAIYSSNCFIEVYELDVNSGYEWRIVEVCDSVEAVYGNPHIALADAILFRIGLKLIKYFYQI